MAGHLIDRGDTLRESHVELFSAYDVRLFNHLDEHPLESLIASLDTSNLLGAFQRCGVDANSFLGHRLSEDTAVVQSAIRG